MKHKLTEKQRAIIIGNVLGDGYLEFNGFRGTRLQMKQAERSKEYIWWLYNEFQDICKSEPKQRKDNNQWFFGTRYLDELTILRNIFYDANGKKIVPDDIENLLTDPLTLAIWYMDDGTLDWRPKDHFAFSLTINCFSVEESQKLSQALLKNFSIYSSIQNPLCRGKRYPKLYIGKNGRETFLNLIQPYIIGCFNYKLPPL